MSGDHQGQDVRHQKGLEIYQEAARILEELLEKRHEQFLQLPHKVKNKTRSRATNGAPADDVGIGKTSSEITASPSKQRASVDKEMNNDRNLLIQNDQSPRKIKHEHRGGSESSVDTDDDESEVSGKRRKKSLFKRAAERLRQTFRQREKEGFMKSYKSAGNSSPNRNQKSKLKPVAESVSRGQEEAGGKENRTAGVAGKSPESRKHTQRSKTSSRTEELTNNHNNKDVQNLDPHKNRTENPGHEDQDLPPHSSSSSLQEPNIARDASHPLKDLNQTHSTPLPALSPHQGHLKVSSAHGPSSQRTAQHLPTGTRSLGPPQSLSGSKSFGSSLTTTVTTNAVIIEATSTSSCDVLQSGDTSEGSHTNLLPSIRSNLLDSPGEEIEYMDNETNITTHINDNPHRLSQAAVDQILGGHGLMDVIQQAGSSSGGSVQVVGLEIIERVVSPHKPVGTSETADVRKRAEEGELPAQTYRLDQNREVLYGKIALKLIEMADTYSTSLSDQEMKGAVALQQPSLSDLEKEIIACLRKGGDRNSKQLEISFEEATQQTTQDAYERFHSTVQNSMGSDLSWDHVAFLFYTTKGVVSAFGKGSRRANQVKEFTLQYISDTFASWIMEQGGFDSVLSTGESDFDVD